MNKWNEVWHSETSNIVNYANSRNNELICFAAGPLSKIWIPLCMDVNPSNIYLDIGSAMDYYTKGLDDRRPYTIPGSSFSRECCSFNI